MEAGGGFAPEEDDGAFAAEGIGGAVAGVIGGFVAEGFSELERSFGFGSV